MRGNLLTGFMQKNRAVCLYHKLHICGIKSLQKNGKNASIKK